MKPICKLTALSLSCVGFSQAAFGQIPDLLNAFDAGGRSLGIGGALHGTDPSPMSAFYNPASLGYISHGEVEMALHNLPNSVSLVSNSRTNPEYLTKGKSGSRALTDFGVAIPVKPLFKGGKASIALNYNVGGYVHDLAVGPSTGLTDGSLTLQNYQLKKEVRTDFVTLAYGQTTKSKSLAFGAGIVYAENHTVFNESATATDGSGAQIPFDGSDIDDKNHGLGFIVGGQYIPTFNPNLSLGLSYRTPISLNSGGDAGIYDKIPGRLLADVSYRLPGLSSSDYAILAGQYQYFFGGDSSVAFDRDTQSVYGVGLEYNHLMNGYRIPVRIGYQSASSGGLGFASTQAFTYGIGFRPVDSRFSLDLNWTSASGGGKDFGISAGYRFGK